MQERSEECHKEVIMSRGGKEAFWGVINILEEILPMDQITKPILNSSIEPLPVYHYSILDSILGFVELSLLPVLRQVTETHLITMS